MRRSHSNRGGWARAVWPGRIALFVLLLGSCAGLWYLLSQRPEAAATQRPTATPRPAVQTAATSDGHAEETQIQDATGYAAQAYGLQSRVLQDGETVERFTRDAPIRFSTDGSYGAVRGLTTYAGNSFRGSFAYGIAPIKTGTLTRLWSADTTSITTLGGRGDTWKGTGWTGMPLIVQWSAEVRAVLGVGNSFRNMSDFTEVIYPAADGNIYFFELNSGVQTRTPIHIGVVMKGTATLDPRGYPLLYVGQGVEDEVDGKGSWVRAISLIDNTVIWSFGGRDPSAYREYHAFDGSALFCGEADTLFVPAENGILYSIVMHTSFDAAAGSIRVEPEPIVKYLYTADGCGSGEGERMLGIESSLSAYGSYGFFADNAGYLQCVDLNAMMPRYAVDLKRECDATPVLEASGGGFCIYTATLAGTGEGRGSCFHRKLDGASGAVIWEREVETYLSQNGACGSLGTPHAGRGKIADLVIFNATMTPVEADGEQTRGATLTAYDKATGETVWEYKQCGGYWSSPVVVYDAEENAYVLQCDRDGILMLLNARDGSVVTTIDLGSRIESTPAVFNDMLVVGTKGEYGSGEGPKILGVKLG